MDYVKAEPLTMGKTEWDFMLYSSAERRGGEDKPGAAKFEESPTP